MSNIIHDIIIVDYIELLGLTTDDIIKLKEKIINTNKTLILVSCCASNKKLFNEHYYKLKEISDIMLLTDK